MESKTPTVQFPSLPKEGESKITPQISSQTNNPSQQNSLSFSFGSDPDKFIQTKLTPHDYAHALEASLPKIPDPPYDVQNLQNQQEKTEMNFPVQTKLKLLKPEFFEHYELTTLFFLFFYNQNTTQRYFAGEELKKRDWIFNKKYRTWFHRIGNQKEAFDRNSQYLLGEFEYFDVGTGEDWCIRKCKSPSFRFDVQDAEL